MSFRKITALAVVGLMSQSAYAAWEVTPEARVEVGHEDNIRLAPQNEQDATVATAEVRGHFRNVTERSHFDARAIARFTHYDGADLDDVDSQTLRIDTERRGERWGAGVTADVRRDTLLRYGQTDSTLDASADEISDAIDPIDPEQGTIEVNVDRTRFSLVPYVLFQLSERSRVEVQGIYRKMTFDKTQNLNIHDSEEKGAGVQYAYSLSERDTLSARAEQTTFDPDQQVESKLSRASLTWARRVTERTTWSLEGGVRRSEPDNASAQTGALLRGTIRHRTERSRIMVLAERSNTPTAFGDVYEFDRAFIEWQHALTERWTSYARAQYTRTESENSANQFRADREYREVFAGVRHAITPEWSIGAEYRHRQVERSNENGTGRSNGFYLSVEYLPLTQF